MSEPALRRSRRLKSESARHSESNLVVKARGKKLAPPSPTRPRAESREANKGKGPAPQTPRGRRRYRGGSREAPSSTSRRSRNSHRSSGKGVSKALFEPAHVDGKGRDEAEVLGTAADKKNEAALLTPLQSSQSAQSSSPATSSPATSQSTKSSPGRKAADRSKAKPRTKLVQPKSPRKAVVLHEVRQVYSIVHRMTGSIGGNGSGGAIYGEQTMESMQKVIDMMKSRAGLDSTSVFVDVGAGLGKPNLHVALDPVVQASVGIEMERVRWMLALHNLRHCLPHNAGNNAIVLWKDMMDATSFNPFTHVYMFDIGFPPVLFEHIRQCLERSSTAEFLLCYHRPSIMIYRYGYKLEFLEQLATSMHGAMC